MELSALLYWAAAMLPVNEHHRGRTADGHGQFTGQFRVGDAAGAVCAKQSSHNRLPSF